LGNAKPVKIMGKDGKWIVGQKQRKFNYGPTKDTQQDLLPSTREQKKIRQIMFVENDANETVTVEVPFRARDGDKKTLRFSLAPFSAVIVVDGRLEFDSNAIDPQFKSFKREFLHGATEPMLLDWSSWPEQIGARSGDPMTWASIAPLEQTRLNFGSRISSDYAWYETDLMVEKSVKVAELYIETQRSSGLLVFIDERYVGAADDHSHALEGNYTVKVLLGNLASGKYKLRILYENFGYSNLIGRFGNSGTGPKWKGITGDVFLRLGNNGKNKSLVDGREWKSYPGLHGEQTRRNPVLTRTLETNSNDISPEWYSALFDSPTYDPAIQGLFLHITEGRGHFWLNGKDLGRYWNITRRDTDIYSQEYYFLPPDYLRTDGTLNEIILFDAFGSEHPQSTSLVLSGVVSSDNQNFQDQVNYPFACI
jgi:hypothetical protein